MFVDATLHAEVAGALNKSVWEIAMSRTLIVFHSRSGATRRVAQDLARRLGADLDEVQIVQPLGGLVGYTFCALEAVTGLTPALLPGRKDPADYDLVVIGTPVWCWSLSSPMRTWFEQHRRIQARVAFFCTMGGAGEERVFAAMAALLGKKPVATLALTDRQAAGGASDQVETFVQALQGRRKAGSARAAKRARTTRPAMA
jgi:flavodoxin